MPANIYLSKVNNRNNKKLLMAPFYGWGSNASRLKSHYEEVVYY